MESLEWNWISEGGLDFFGMRIYGNSHLFTSFYFQLIK